MSSFTKSSIPQIEVYRNTSERPWTYEQLDARQREIARRIRQGGAGALLLSELAPVITLGRRTPESDLLMGREALIRRGIQCVRTDRGGFATYHGPGQWVLFPVDRLDRLTGDPRGVRIVVRKLLGIAKRVAEGAGVGCEIREGAELGVWSPRGKIAALGIRLEGGILHHGLSLNVFRTPESFLGIRPCGLDSAVDFLYADASEAQFSRTKEDLTQAVAEELWGSRLRAS